jgi:hypothetical protein
MASERDQAKLSITKRETDEPELDEAISAAQNLAHELDLKIEEHRHEEAMHSARLGAIGRFLGSEASTSVAFIAVCAGILSAFFCYGCAAYSPAVADFWGKQAERSIAFSVSALSFIFGRNVRSRK